jgi:hypothetical protein
MDILAKSFDALWQVLVVGLLLGAGLPALFALGLRSLNTGRTTTATAGAGGGGGSAGLGRVGSSSGGGVATYAGTETSKPSTLGLIGAIICFTILIAAVLFGIVVIIFGKQLFG